MVYVRSVPSLLYPMSFVNKKHDPIDDRLSSSPRQHFSQSHVQFHRLAHAFDRLVEYSHDKGVPSFGHFLRVQIQAHPEVDLPILGHSGGQRRHGGRGRVLS